MLSRTERLRSSQWLWTPERAGLCRVRLLCLPYAGGGAGVFVPWAKALPESVEVWSVRLPGRESRWKEPAMTSIAAIARELATEVTPYLAEMPFVVFGYSLGSLIGFELLKELRRRGMPMPKLFFAAGRGAPQRPLRASPTHTLPDREFLEAIAQRYQGIPQMILEDRELLNLYLPPLRADMTANETYRYNEEAPFDVPFVTMGGIDDRSVGFEDLAAWRAQTNATFEMEMFPGGHFFLQEQRAQLLSALRRRLADLSL